MDTRQRMAERRRIARVGDRRVYHWIKAIVDGRLFVDGPYGDEDSAWTAGYNNVKVNFNIVKLNTRDTGEATRQLKHMMLEETHDIRDSTRNARHGRKEDL